MKYTQKSEMFWNIFRIPTYIVLKYVVGKNVKGFALSLYNKTIKCCMKYFWIVLKCFPKNVFKILLKYFSKNIYLSNIQILK